MSGLLKEERLQKILQAIQRDGLVNAGALSRLFGVSEITIRRDLRILAEQGFLRRSHGGAIVVSPKSQEPPVIQRMLQAQEIKKAIGRAAAARIHDGESIFIGSGSTTAYVARHLVDRRRLTVITNALNVGVDLALAPDVTVVVLGGLMRPEELSLVGHIAEQALREVRIDKVIMGIPAIDLRAGLTNDYLPEVVTDRTIIDMASEVILVADHTKFDKIASAYVAPVGRINTLVTDNQTDPECLERIRALGVEVVIAE